jgi:hypothetical protein
MHRLHPLPGRVPAFALGLALALLSGCGDEPATPGEKTIDIDVYFNINVDGPGLQLAGMNYQNAAGTTYSILALRFILSDLTLHTGEGRSVPLKSVHFYDVADGSTQFFRLTGLPHDNYTSLSFTFGLDESKNVRNRYSSDGKLHAAMQWPAELGAGLGYYYLQLEGRYETSPGGPTAEYRTHTGARQLDGSHPGYPGVVDATPHHFHFRVDAPFTPVHIHEGENGLLQIYFNLNGWYTDHTPSDGFDSAYDFKTLPDQTITADLDAQAKLQANGPFCFFATLEPGVGHGH